MTTRLLSLFLLLGCGTAANDGAPASAPKPAPAAAAPAPASAESRVALANAEAVRTALTDASDHVRVFNFWAMWCQPCIAELPHLAELAADADDDVIDLKESLSNFFWMRSPDSYILVQHFG